MKKTPKSNRSDKPASRFTKSKADAAITPKKATGLSFVVAFYSQTAGPEYKFSVQVSDSSRFDSLAIVTGARLIGEDAATVTVPVKAGQWWRVVDSGPITTRKIQLIEV